MSKFQNVNPIFSRKTLTRLTTSAMMVALSIVFTRLLGFPSSGQWRVEIGFFPIAIIAVFYGPIWSALSYGLADFIGALLFTGINPFILICKIVFGLLMGLFFYRKTKIGLIRNIAFFVICGFLVDILMMTPIFVYMFGYTLESALVFRGAAFLINTPVRILLIILANKYFFPAICKYIAKKENFSNGSGQF